MNNIKNIFLFDLDGVLVDPLGYRAALRATLDHFLHQIGIDSDLIPSANEIELFEGMHITSEWDMVPLILGEILDELVLHNPDIHLPAKVAHLTQLTIKNKLTQVDFRPLLEALSPNLNSHEYPADTALRLSNRPDIFINSGTHPPFSHIQDKEILMHLLSHTREPDKSATTRCFQHFTLGSEVYSQVYGSKPDFESESLLAKNDIPQLSPNLRARLLHLWQTGRLSIAALTNRPSAPPRESSSNYLGYAPEAELALNINGLGEIPLIGFGRIQFFADQNNIEPETLIKPSPFQAIAAIFAALTRQELRSLYTAHAILNNGQLNTNLLTSLISDFGWVEPPTHLNIHIFEDTRWGIQSTRQAGIILEKIGVSNTIYGWGIAASVHKIKSLESFGAQVYKDVSTAIQAALEIN